MTLAHKKTLATFLLLALPSIGAGCSAESTDSGDEENAATTESALAINPVKPPGTKIPIGPVEPIGPIGPVVSPPVKLPSYFDTSNSQRTANSLGLGWYENGPNPHTQVWRQRYDLNEHPVGTPTLIKTFNNLASGAVNFIDSTATTDDHSGPDTDRLNCYQVVETTGDCNASPGGPDCLRTPQMACAYTRGAVAHKVGRVQLRIKVGSLSSAAATSNSHIQVRLQSPSSSYVLLPEPRNNSTWIDSTQVDYKAGSDRTYDLKTTNIGDLSDITMITIANPGSNDLCINQFDLLVDNTTVFSKSWGPATACASTLNSDDSLNGKVVNATFGELRHAPSWIDFSPPNLSPDPTKYASFVGFKANDLISYLDTVMADQLKDPAKGRGADAGLYDGVPTSTTWVDRRTLRVAQHIVAQDLGWQGNVYADVFYNLAIHSDAGSCGNKQWCIKVENVTASSTFSGWSAFIPVIGLGIQAAVDSDADGEIQNAMNAMGANSLGAPPASTEFCFPNGTSVVSLFDKLGFGDRSLTLCF